MIFMNEEHHRQGAIWQEWMGKFTPSPRRQALRLTDKDFFVR
jgi:hypothetical protein